MKLSTEQQASIKALATPPLVLAAIIGLLGVVVAVYFWDYPNPEGIIVATATEVAAMEVLSKEGKGRKELVRSMIWIVIATLTWLISFHPEAIATALRMIGEGAKAIRS